MRAQVSYSHIDLPTVEVTRVGKQTVTLEIRDGDDSVDITMDLKTALEIRQQIQKIE